MITRLRYEVLTPGTRQPNDIEMFDQIERLQSQDGGTSFQDSVESDGAEENQRSSQRLPPLNEDECSVFSQGKHQLRLLS